MSKEIDRRVVQMRFDNAQFERGAKTSMDTINNLKKSLDFEGSAKGLENLGSSVKKLNFNPLAAGVEAVKTKFSALEVMAVTTLANITNSLVNTGKQMVESLTIAPIKQGFDEYELKMGSVQTIMASTGASLAEVNGYLDELNTYADKTIYSFSDMTSSIGKFTNAGVDLDSAVKAIQGISNEAAVSGANAEQASHAMYNFAQALSSGSVKLIDWKSIENANMATVEFKQHLIDTAVALGTVVKEGDKYVSTTTNAKGEVSEAFDATSMFNDSLSSQWMTTDVLVKTLGEYADETTEIGKKAFAAAQDVKTFSQLMDTLGEAVGSGWSETWEILFGDFNEAKKLWTEVSNVVGGFIDKQSKARNDLLQGWKDMGGRADAIEAVKNAFDGLVSVVKPIKEAFREIFPATTAKQLYDLTNKIKDFTEKMKLSDEQAEKLKNVFGKLFSVIKFAMDTVKTVVSWSVKLIKKLSSVGEVASKVSEFFGKFASKSSDSAKSTNFFAKALSAINGAMQKFSDSVSEFVNKYGKKLADIIEKANTKLKEFFAVMRQKFEILHFSQLLDIFKGIHEIVSKIVAVFGKMFSVIINVGKSVVPAMQKLNAACKDMFGYGILDTIIKGLAGGGLVAIINNIRKLSKSFGEVSSIIEIFKNGLKGTFDGFAGVLKGVTGVLDGVKGCFVAWQRDIKAAALMKIAKAVAILAGSLLVLSLIPSDRLGSALAGLSVIFMELSLTLSRFSKMEMGLKGTGKTISIMLGVSVSVLILASALKKLSSLSWEGLAKGLIGVFALTEMIVLVCKQLDKIKGRAAKGAANIVMFAASIKTLAFACTDLAKLSWEELAKGLLGVGVLLAEVDIFLNTAKFSGKAFAACLGMIELASAIKILASAAGDFAQMEWNGIAKGLGAIGGLLLELGLFVNLTGKAKHIVSTGFALIEIAAAMKMFASAVSDFSQLSWSEIGRGLTAMGVALAEIVVSLKLMPKNVFGIGAGLVIVGAALNIISASVSQMGGMSWSEVAKGLAAMGGSMLILALGLNGMKKSVKGVAALTVAAGALALLVPELKILGGMSIQQIGISLVALAGSFLVLGVAAKVLSPLAGTMVKVAGAVSLFGIACALAGAGILSVSVGLASLSASLIVVVSSLGEIISGVCYSIANSAKAISAAFVGLIEAACIALKGTIPLVANTLVTVLVESLTSLKTYLPKIVDLVMDIAVQLMDKLTLRIPEVVTSAVNMVGRFMDALNKALGTKSLKNLISSLKSVAIIFVAFAETAKIISELSVKDVLKGLPAFALAVAGFGVILAALGGISKIPGATEVIESGAKIFAAMGNAIGAFIGCLITGIIENLPKDVGQTIAAMGSIVAIVLALAPVVEALSEIQADIKNVLKGMASIGVVLAGITAVLAAFGGLSAIPGFDELITNGSVVLSSIGKALGGFVGSLIDGLTQAMTSDMEGVAKALISVCSTLLTIGVLTKIIKGINPADAAMGIAALAVVILGLEAIFAALGGLAQIPGFNWIINEGGEALAKIGYILGDFVGSIVGGFGAGATGGLPVIGENLSSFMESATPFVEGAKNISGEMLDGVKALAETVLILTAADLISGITSFITGGSSIVDFGNEIAEFGPCIKAFSDSVVGVNPQNVAAASEAGKALAEMADKVPNEGGVAGFFAGENSLAKFGNEIVAFGDSLGKFGTAVNGIVPENIKAAAEAGKALAEMADKVPNEGGVAGFFAGENSLAKFGSEIVVFGVSLGKFGTAVNGIVPENIKAAAEAGKALAEMADKVPNEGGVAGFFAGENSLAKFGNEIVTFGISLGQFGTAVNGIVPENIKAAAEAGKALAEMADKVPNEGGVAGFFAGENSLAKFGNEIVTFGTSLGQFGTAVADVDPEKIRAASEAGKALAEMADKVPNEGGVAGFFAGENSLAKFGKEIETFGVSLGNFGRATSEVKPDKIRAASEAGKALAEMADKVPNEKGVLGFFVGENSLAKFGEDIAVFGKNLRDFDKNVAGIIPENIKSAAEAGKNLAAMCETIPNSDGIKAWFAGDNNVAKFGKDIASFGTNLSDFDKNVAGIIPENIKAAAEAGKNLAEMVSVVPDSGGIKAWFTGDNNVAKFGKKIAEFGSSLAEFSNNVSDIDSEKIASAAEAGKNLAEMANFGADCDSIDVMASSIGEFGNTLSEFSNKISDVDVSNANTQIKKIITLSNEIKGADLSALNEITTTLKNLADDGLTKFKNTFANAGSDVKKAIATFVNNVLTYINDADPDFKTAAKDLIESFVTGTKDKTSDVKSAFTALLNDCREIIENRFTNFKTVAKDLVKNFVTGIKDKTSDAKSAFSTLLNDCRTIIESCFTNFKTLGENLLSNLHSGITEKSNSMINPFVDVISDWKTSINNQNGDFYDAGKYLCEGFENGVTENLGGVRNAGNDLGLAALEGAKTALDEHSPSKETYSIGEYAVLGMTNALTKLSYKAYDAGENVANSAADGISDAISGISDIIDGKVKCEPTIRPVLDLSRVKKGASEINGMFSAKKTVALAASTSPNISRGQNIVDAISSLRKDGSSNKDVVDAVTALRKDITSQQSTGSNQDVIEAVAALRKDILANQNGVSSSIDIVEAVTALRKDISLQRNNVSNQDVVDAVSGLRSDVSSLRGALGNLKVVMDNGALVGSIVNDMDKALGTKTKLAKRRL